MFWNITITLLWILILIGTGFSLLLGTTESSVMKKIERNCSVLQSSWRSRYLFQKLGQIVWVVEWSKVNEIDNGSSDETQVFICMDNSTTIGFNSCKDDKYADVVSCGEGFTMMVRLRGWRDTRIEPLFWSLPKNTKNSQFSRCLMTLMVSLIGRVRRDGWEVR